MNAFFRKLLSPVVELRETELATALMMFAYSFLVMTSYTALKPVTRSQFIKDLGADNLPLVQFAFGLHDRLHHAGLLRPSSGGCRAGGPCR